MTSRRSELPGPCYTPQLDSALTLVAEAFRFRIRKGSGVPYLTHLLQVCCTVGEWGGDEEQMIAALLHDYLEDIEGASRAGLEARFGARVAGFVEALSDATERPKPPWRKRKVAYVAAVRSEPAELKLISAADKLHNACSIVRDQRRMGDEVFERFTANKAQTLWYYRAMREALAADWDHAILVELTAAVDEMHRLAGSSYRPEEPAGAPPEPDPES